MDNFLDIGKTGNFSLWFWGVCGLFFGALLLIEGNFVAGTFITVTAVSSFYELYKRKNKIKKKHFLTFDIYKYGINLFKIIKKFVKQNGFKIVISLSLVGLFYWYEWRPSEIKKKCLFIFLQSYAVKRILS